MPRDRADTTAIRYARERAFHDERFADDDRRANRFYAIDAAANAYRMALVDSAPRDSVFLEYGCGAAASSAVHLASQGRPHVVAIDISRVAVTQAEAKARALGLESRIEFHEMNAEALTFPDDSFDIVCGSGVLHHLDLDLAYREIARVLRPQGRAIFLEPMGHNPLINLYRQRTPEQRTPDEHPLLTNDLELAWRYFRRVESTHFALSSLLGLPVATSRVGPRVLGWLDAADRAMFRRIPATRRLSWLVVIELIGSRTGGDREGSSQPEGAGRVKGRP